MRKFGLLLVVALLVAIAMIYFQRDDHQARSQPAATSGPSEAATVDAPTEPIDATGTNISTVAPTTSAQPSTDFASWMQPPLDANLAEMADELIRESSKGNLRATCRYLTDVEACHRYSQLVAGKGAKGQIGPYASAQSPSEIDELDRVIFGRPMESMQKVCVNNDEWPHLTQPPRLMTELVRARDIAGYGAASDAAAVLFLSDAKLEKRNLEILETSATAGNIQSLAILGNMGEGSGFPRYDPYPELSDVEKTEQHYRWRALYARVVAQWTEPSMPKPMLGKLLDQYASRISPERKKAIDVEVEQKAMLEEFQSRVWKNKTLLYAPLDESYCVR